MRGLFINGKWVDAAGRGRLDVIDPSTGRVIGEICAGSADDVRRAVSAARDAFDHGPWPRASGQARAEKLREIAGRIRDKADILARIETRDNGKPLPEALLDIEDAAACFDYYASLAEEAALQDVTRLELPDARFRCEVQYEPVGVVAAIIPWNYPLLMAAWKVAPALAAGCTVVLKPSELTSLTALELACIADDVELPPGVLNVVTGDGPSVGGPLVEHPDVNKVAFTGSLATGSRVMQAAAMDIKRVSLELGGKSPLLLFADSDLSAAVEWIMFGIFWNQGQVCSATSRVLVERPLYEALLERLAAEAARITIGAGDEPGVLLGPLVSQGQYDKVCAAITRAVEEGAQLVCGGVEPVREHGYFVAPTVLTGMAFDSWIWTEEVFGPVLCVAPFDTEEEAVRLANQSQFGLAAAVFSRSQAQCDRVSRVLQAGIVWVNCSQPTFVQAPWGGVKRSGIGRELGRWGFDSYREAKQITQYTSDQPWGWYLKQ